MGAWGVARLASSSPVAVALLAKASEVNTAQNSARTASSSLPVAYLSGNNLTISLTGHRMRKPLRQSGLFICVIERG